MDNSSYASAVKDALFSSIDDLSANKDLFLKNPGKDFSRKRMIDFESFINFCLQMEGRSVQNELLKYYEFSEYTPTSSAFSQQRGKVDPAAFTFLFNSFTERLRSIDTPKCQNGYLMIAIDGSDIKIPHNPDNPDSLFKVRGREYNMTHLNVLFDIHNGIYHDVIIAPIRQIHEKMALNLMVDRFNSLNNSGKKAIFIADRGYESYNTFAHIIESGNKFVVRLKDIGSTGILKSYGFPDTEFDVAMDRIITRKRTKKVLQDKDKYTIIACKSDFDFFDSKHPFYEMSLRFVRFEILPGVFECLATNLDKEEFPLSAMKDLYHLRWGVETSFRDLKFTIDLVHFHCRKKEFIEQELYSRLTVYNFCEAITRHICVTRQTLQKRRKGGMCKYTYKINFATAVCICRAYLKENGGSEINVCRLIGRFLIPIRPNRKAARDIKEQYVKPFIYRAA